MDEFDLNAIRVENPCTQDWQMMQGNNQVRFCQQCQLNVYNLSGMNSAEAKALLNRSEGRLCVRYYQRADGTVMTQDCVQHLQARHRKTFIKKLAGVASVLTIVTLSNLLTVQAESQVISGGMAIPAPTNLQAPTPKMGDYERPEPPQPTMGEPVRVAPPPEVKMGKMIPSGSSVEKTCPAKKKKKR